MTNGNPNNFSRYKEKTLAFLKEKGLYVVTLLCLLVVGGAALFAYAPRRGEAAQPTPTHTQNVINRNAATASRTWASGRLIHRTSVAPSRVSTTPTPPGTPEAVPRSMYEGGMKITCHNG